MSNVPVNDEEVLTRIYRVPGSDQFQSVGFGEDEAGNPAIRVTVLGGKTEDMPATFEGMPVVYVTAHRATQPHSRT